MYLLKKVLNPDIFQGKHKKKNYFEGWYYKLIDKQSKNVYAIIPGIACGSDTEDAHAFIQVINAVSGIVDYFRFILSDFTYSTEKFQIYIGDNTFTDRGAEINLKNNNTTIKGKISFKNIVPFPKTLFNPGIMGPYSFVPFMECYHGIVNIHNEIEGELIFNDMPVDFTGGYGYIEKDWGKSFPESWIWLQSNHFGECDASVMFSLAKIPWFNHSFNGFISFLRLGEKLYRFATYTNAKISVLNYNDEDLDIAIEDKKHSLIINTQNQKGAILKAPKNGMMNRDITESISAVVDVKLRNKQGHVLFAGTGRNTGLEMAGDVFELLP